MTIEIITPNIEREVKEISVKESKMIYFNYIKKNCNRFKNAKFYYNDIHISLDNYSYFTLKFSEKGVDLYERIYVANRKSFKKLEVFPLNPDQEALNYLIARYLY